jgi:hypothetical protein
VIALKIKVCKRGLSIFFIAIFIIVGVVKIGSSFIFYRNSFNYNVYDDLLKTQSYSQSVWYSIDEILKDENTADEGIINLKWNYDETLQNLQRLNSKIMRVSEKHQVNLGNYAHLISLPLANIKLKYSEQIQNVNLTEEEINVLIETKEIFKTLSEIINENLNNISDLSSWGEKDVLRNDAWLDIMKDIQENIQ